MDQNQNPEQAAPVPQPEQPAYAQAPQQTNFSQPPQPANPSPEAAPLPPEPPVFAQPSMDAQPLAQQPYSAPQQPVAPPLAAVPQKNPGLVFGIIGIVLSFIFLAPIGLVLSIIGTVKSHKAQTSAAVSIIGIVLNALALIGGVFFLFITLAAYSGVQQRAKDVTVETNAHSVVAHAEQYYAEKGSYPASAAELAAYDSSASGYSIVAENPTSSSTIQYVACGQDGGQVLYLLPSTSSVDIYPVGNASDTARC